MGLACRAGIFDGKTDGTFGINDNLTRTQMAKVLVNAFDLDIQKGNIFNDISADYWAKDYISTLYISGITVGSNGKYMPNDKVSRAHYATFLFRALNLNEAPKSEPETKPETPITNTPFPKSDTVKTPAGWTESKMKEYDERIKEIVFEKSPKRGSGISFGKGGYALYEFDDQEFP